MRDWNDIYKQFLDGLPDGLSDAECRQAWHSYQAEVRKQDWFSNGGPSDWPSDNGGDAKKFDLALAEIRAQEERHRIGAAEAGAKLRLRADHARACHDANVKNIKTNRRMVMALAVSLTVANVVYMIYDLVPVKCKNVASRGRVIYWRTLSGREGLRIEKIPDDGSLVHFEMKDGRRVEYTIFPGASENVPSDRAPDAIIEGAGRMELMLPKFPQRVR
jgi:hypothetical protein